ncbi:MAG: class I adenylate-forming enzyme family protein [Gammaproteobacteria bacterium]
MNKPQSITIGSLLRELSAIDPDHEAIVEHNQCGTRVCLSYQQLEIAVSKCSRALLAAGIERGDRCGILAGNRSEWLIAHFAITSIGAISVGLNTWATAQELAYQLAHAKVKLLFLEPHFRERDFVRLLADARNEEGGLPDLRDVVLLDEYAGSSAPAWEEFIDRGTDIDAATVVASVNQVLGADIACLLYTSGSTALPKGVPLLHRGLIHNMWEIGERLHLEHNDRLWLAVSLFWSLASVNALFAVFTHRATIVLQHHFDAGQALKLIEDEKCTVFYGTPNMTLGMAEHVNLAASDLGSLRTGVTIGTPAQVQRVADLGVAEICNVYGLTESYGNSTVTDAKLPLSKRLETVGKALPGQQIKIIDAKTQAALEAGETGEIVLHGNQTPGYWEDPQKSEEARTDDGWFRTGDLGFLDAEGYLYYRGRLKEMVKTGGINVSPAEVEQVLSGHPAVELAFVTGIPDERLDEALAAVIVLKTNRRTDADELASLCRATMAAYKTPRHFRFVSATELPLTSTGKLQRNRLHELFT